MIARRTALKAAVAGAVAAPFLNTRAHAKTKIRMQGLLPATAPGHLAMEDGFVKGMSSLTNGKVEIDMFPVDAIVPAKEGLDAVGNGVVDSGFLMGGFFSGTLGLVSSIEAGVPGAERTPFERYAFFYKHGFIELARKAYARHNVHYLGPNLSPPWDLMSKKPIRKMADINGMKIRVHGIEGEWYERMGASTVFMSGGEMYTALATGVVDAARWGSPSTCLASSLHEVTKYYVQPSSMPAPNNHIIINLDLWNSLSAEIQAMMDYSARAASLNYLGIAAADDAAAMRKMQEAGVEVTRIPDSDWAEMERIARSVWREKADADEMSAQSVAMLNEFLASLGRA